MTELLSVTIEKDRNRAFEIVWDTSSSIQEVADRMGMKHVTVRTHATYMRKTGTRLKCLCCHCPEKGR